MSVPLVMAATATSVGAPAYAAGSKHAESAARASPLGASERILRSGDTGPDVVRLQRRSGSPPTGSSAATPTRGLAFQRATAS